MKVYLTRTGFVSLTFLSCSPFILLTVPSFTPSKDGENRFAAQTPLRRRPRSLCEKVHRYLCSVIARQRPSSRINPIKYGEGCIVVRDGCIPTECLTGRTISMSRRRPMKRQKNIARVSKHGILSSLPSLRHGMDLQRITGINIPVPISGRDCEERARCPRPGSALLQSSLG